MHTQQKAFHEQNLAYALVSSSQGNYRRTHVLCIITDNAVNIVSMVKQLNERPREGSSTNE